MFDGGPSSVLDVDCNSPILDFIISAAAFSSLPHLAGMMNSIIESGATGIIFFFIVPSSYDRASTFKNSGGIISFLLKCGLHATSHRPPSWTVITPTCFRLFSCIWYRPRVYYHLKPPGKSLLTNPMADYFEVHKGIPAVFNGKDPPGEGFCIYGLWDRYNLEKFPFHP